MCLSRDLRSSDIKEQKAPSSAGCNTQVCIKQTRADLSDEDPEAQRGGRNGARMQTQAGSLILDTSPTGDQRVPDPASWPCRWLPLWHKCGLPKATAGLGKGERSQWGTQAKAKPSLPLLLAGSGGVSRRHFTSLSCTQSKVEPMWMCPAPDRGSLPKPPQQAEHMQGPPVLIMGLWDSGGQPLLLLLLQQEARRPAPLPVPTCLQG